MDTISFDLREKDAAITIKVNPKIYPLYVVYSASYVFLDKCYIMLDGDPEKEIFIELRLKENSSFELGEIAKDFFNELLNYAFYEEQSRKNAALRNTLLKTALLTNIDTGEGTEECESCKESEGESEPDWSDIEELEDDEFDDPDGIATPWEDKYGNNEKNEDQKNEQSYKLPEDVLNKECDLTEAMSSCTDKKLRATEDSDKLEEAQIIVISKDSDDNALSENEEVPTETN